MRENKGKEDSMKTLFKIFACVVLSILTGCVLMIAVYLLPTAPMSDNIARSSELFDAEGIYPAWAKGYKMTQLNNWTEGYILCSAIYPGENLFVDAMQNPIIEYEEQPITLSLTLQANDVDGETYVREYGRYWHGMLVLLKPLLLLFDVGDIRIINMIIQIALIFAIVIRLVETDNKKIILPFFLAIMVINPITLPMSFVFSAEYLLMLTGTLIVINKNNWLMVENRYKFFFCILGCATAFFNELSFPMVTLGIPLICWLLINDLTWEKKLKGQIVFSAIWAMSYSLMWLGKWICATLITGYNYFAEVVSQANTYVVDDAYEPEVWERLWKNISVIAKWPFFILFSIVVIILLIKLCKAWRQNSSKSFKGFILCKMPYILLLFYPFVLYIALGNGYSYEHYWFSYRQLSITVAAGICILLEENIDINRSEL